MRWLLPLLLLLGCIRYPPVLAEYKVDANGYRKVAIYITYGAVPTDAQTQEARRMAREKCSTDVAVIEEGAYGYSYYWIFHCLDSW